MAATRTKELDTGDTLDAARQQYAAARQARQDAHDALDDFKARILAGDLDVSTEAYAEAGHAAEVAELRLEAAELALQGAEQRARLHTLEQIKAEILTEAGHPDEILAAMRQVEEGAAILLGYDKARNTRIGQWIAALRTHQVPRLSKVGKEARGEYTRTTDEHADLGWSSRDATWANDAIYIGDRTITTFADGFTTSAALARAVKAAGLYRAAVTFNVQAPHDEFVNDPETWLRGRY